MTNHTPANYQNLINTISAAFQQGQQKTYQAINTGLLKQLSRDLKAQHGKGFSVSNLQRFRLFYGCFENYATVSHELTWSHYVELLKTSNDTERQFYLFYRKSATVSHLLTW